jgi:protein SCO1/2
MRTLTTLALAASLLAFAVGCQNSGKVASPTAASDKVYDLRGTVVAVDAAKNTVTLDHEDIPGLMRAMKMSFTVEDHKILTDLKEGDKVEGKLKARADGTQVVTELRKRSGS